jgi:hypothetical protein
LLSQRGGIELAIHFRKTQPECKVLLFVGQSIDRKSTGKARAQGYDFDLHAKRLRQADLWAKLRL